MICAATIPISSESNSVELAFRPHVVALDAAVEGEALRMEGVIEGGEFLGEFMRYEVRVRQAIVTADQAHRRGTQPFAKGTSVRLAVPSGEVRVMAGSDGA